MKEKALPSMYVYELIGKGLSVVVLSKVVRDI